MDDQSLSMTYTVQATPEAVFAAIADPRTWWMSDIAGETGAVGAEFGYTVPGIHRVRMRVEELEPSTRVAWRVVDNWMGFIEDQREWVGTLIQFDLTPHDDGTEIRFTHEGLRPQDECYEVCSAAWDLYARQSLEQRIRTGAGGPDSGASAASRAHVPAP